MSHATVLVILNKIDEDEYHESLSDVLAPYEESPDVDSEYCEFFDKTEDLMKQYEEQDEEDKSVLTFKKYCLEEGYYEYPAKSGRFGYFCNSNAKWDWWVVGGRWSNYLKLKNDVKYPEDVIIGESGDFEGHETHCSGARKCDIDFEGMREDQIKRCEKAYDRCIEEYAKDNETTSLSFRYGIRFKDEKPESKEEFVKRESSSLFYSVLKDNEWNSHGDMGWFGIGTNETDDWNEQEKLLIDETDDDSMVVLVDYHI